jgi:CBS domain-containing protein
MAIVKDIMTWHVFSTSVNSTVFEAATFMSSHIGGCLVVMGGEVPVGIVTERDFVQRVIAKKLPLDTKVSEIMSKPLITVKADASLREAARIMSNNKIRRLPVLEHNKLVGIVVAADFVRNLGKMTVSEEILMAMSSHTTSYRTSGSAT